MSIMHKAFHTALRSYFAQRLSSEEALRTLKINDGYFFELLKMMTNGMFKVILLILSQSTVADVTKTDDLQKATVAFYKYFSVKVTNLTKCRCLARL